MLLSGVFGAEGGKFGAAFPKSIKLAPMMELMIWTLQYALCVSNDCSQQIPVTIVFRKAIYSYFHLLRLLICPKSHLQIMTFYKCCGFLCADHMHPKIIFLGTEINKITWFSAFLDSNVSTCIMECVVSENITQIIINHVDHRECALAGPSFPIVVVVSI